MPSGEPQQPSKSQLADISALADGSLDPARRAQVEASVAGDPALDELYHRERSVVERVHEARALSPAPQALRARIAADRAPRRSWDGWRTGSAIALGAAVAAVAVVLGLTLPGSGAGPSISQAAALAARGPDQPPPGLNTQTPNSRLATEVEDVYFPNWSGSFGWQAAGQRVDTLSQQQAVTVYYTRSGQSVAYTIMGGSPLPQPSGSVTVLNHYQLHTLNQGSRTIVTWRRNGHTCVLSATGVPTTVLQHLAAWRPVNVKA